MLFTVHIADVRSRDALHILRAHGRLRHVPGIGFAATMLSVPLRSAGRPRLPNLRRVGLLASWEDDSAHARFATADPVAALLAHGWSARLQPLRVWGAWPEAGPISAQSGAEHDGPAAALTLGRLRVRRTVPFLAASGRAERAAVNHPDMLAGTAFTRPPRLVATFSLWRDTAAVRDYAAGSSPDGHRRAMAAHRARPFHHDAVFIRLRPYDVRGTWDGRDPLAAATGSPASCGKPAGAIRGLARR